MSFEKLLLKMKIMFKCQTIQPFNGFPNIVLIACDARPLPVLARIERRIRPDSAQVVCRE